MVSQCLEVKAELLIEVLELQFHLPPTAHLQLYLTLSFPKPPGAFMPPWLCPWCGCLHTASPHVYLVYSSATYVNPVFFCILML